MSELVTGRVFDEPADAEEAQARLRELGTTLQQICTELANRKAVLAAGEIPQPRYLDWRRRALCKKGHVEKERAYLKNWLAEVGAAAPAGNDAIALLLEGMLEVLEDMRAKPGLQKRIEDEIARRAGMEVVP